MRVGMTIDLKRCVGCNACVAACKAEQGTPPGIFLRRVIKEETGIFPRVRRVPYPLQCMHCQDPACKSVCPTGATTQRDDGIVLVDDEKCVGCRYCMMACPYGSRFYHAKIREYYPGQGLTIYEELMYKLHPTGVAEKCTFCAHRLEKGLEPSCVANCPTKAMIFGDLDEPESEVSRIVRDRRGIQLRAELGTDPSVFYLSP